MDHCGRRLPGRFAGGRRPARGALARRAARAGVCQEADERRRRPARPAAVVRDVGACLVVDGGNSMGQIGAHFAMERAIERAATTGIAAVAVRGSNHCGAMAPYVLQAVAHDMIGIATTNALPTMAPWGGAERLLGINPLGSRDPGRRGMADRLRRRVQRLGARQDPRLPAEAATAARRAGRSTAPGHPPPTRPRRSTACCCRSAGSRAPAWR